MTERLQQGGNETLAPDDEAVALAPIISSYNQRIRPLLDAVEKLRALDVTNEGLELPTIVVVGGQSSGKTSVLESLASISLPRDRGICTRVPLIMCLHSQEGEGVGPELFLEFKGKMMATTEENIAKDIRRATVEIAGGGNAISDIPLKLVIKKKGVPDITLVDLPGIVRDPVKGQPKDIHARIKNMVRKYIEPEESIILNVCSAASDFATSESLQMSKEVDNSGARTLAVVTMVDTAPEGFLDKLVADAAELGFEYVFVKNRTANETHEAARTKEYELFETDPVLSKIDKRRVGIPVLANKLVRTQAKSISKCLPGLISVIKQKLYRYTKDLEKLPRNLTSVSDAISVSSTAIGSAKQTLRKILVTAEFDEYPLDISMHFCARLVDSLNIFNNDLHMAIETGDFLMEEIQALKEHQRLELPDFLPKTAFMFILRRNIEEIRDIPLEFFRKVYDSLEIVILTVLNKHCENYIWLQLCACRGAQNLIEKMKDRCWDWVKEVMEMQAVTDYTCLQSYMSDYENLITQQKDFVDHVFLAEESVELHDLGTVSIGHLGEYSRNLVSHAFCLKMRMLAYWKIVLTRLVDLVASNLQYSLHRLVDQEMEVEIMDQLMSGGGMERMLKEGSPVIAKKREKLTRCIKVLEDSKDVVAGVMKRVFEDSD